MKTEAEVMQFSEELLKLLDRFDPDDSSASQRTMSVVLLAQTVAMAAAGECSKEEFLQSCSAGWDLHWKLFDALKMRRGS
jgi:hypothetical protein